MDHAGAGRLSLKRLAPALSGDVSGGFSLPGVMADVSALIAGGCAKILR